jgi:transketolase C-terminal domain/subunit
MVATDYAFDLKPFDDEALIAKLAAARVVITIENHWVASGLARIIAGALMERQSRARLITVGVGDTFTHGGTGAYLEDFYGIGERHIRGAIAEALGVSGDGAQGSTGGGTIGLTEGVAEGL